MHCCELAVESREGVIVAPLLLHVLCCIESVTGLSLQPCMCAPLTTFLERHVHRKPRWWMPRLCAGARFSGEVSMSLEIMSRGAVVG